MRFYETTIVLGPASDEAAIGHEIDKITQTITSASGRLVTTQRWGTKRMAYPLQKHTQAIYVHFVYQAPPEVPGKLESMFRINENILRHLTVLVEGPLTGKRYGEAVPTEATQPAATPAAPAAEPSAVTATEPPAKAVEVADEPRPEGA